jgi:hypothetical protein
VRALDGTSSLVGLTASEVGVGHSQQDIGQEPAIRGLTDELGVSAEIVLERVPVVLRARVDITEADELLGAPSLGAGHAETGTAIARDVPVGIHSVLAPSLQNRMRPESSPGKADLRRDERTQRGNTI